jgi:hypothetical protein
METGNAASCNAADRLARRLCARKFRAPPAKGVGFKASISSSGYSILSTHPDPTQRADRLAKMTQSG